MDQTSFLHSSSPKRLDDAFLSSPAQPAATRQEWQRRIELALKGAPFDRLISKGLDGSAIQPLYPPASDASPRALRQKSGAWSIAQRVDHPKALEANGQILDDLEQGADALVLVGRQSPFARGFGLDLDSPRSVGAILDHVHLDLIRLRLDAGAQAPVLMAEIAALAATLRLDGTKIDLDGGHDPIALFARTGKISASLAADLALLVRTYGKEGSAARTLMADGRVWHEAGASEAQELGLVISTALDLMRMLESQGMTLDQARRSIAFLLVADVDEFLSIAKFRALRRLWARVEQACGLMPEPVRLHGETSWRMMTRHDPAVNMLRTTMGVFAAAIGGADVITALPFTAVLGLPDAHARRIARNSQLVLLEEANLARVADPAAGAGGFEALTHDLCQKAWEMFQALQKAGGTLKALKDGLPQREIALIAQARAKAIARRKLPLTGVSEFANLHERAEHVLDVSPFEPSPVAAKSSFPLLESRRDSEPFEILRARSDNFLARTGTRPSLFLATPGTVADFTARAMFAKNLCAAGGVEAAGEAQHNTVHALVSAFAQSGARIACLASSDAIYASEAPALAKALQDAGATAIWLAGRPGEHEAIWREAGLTHFMHAGCDVLATLSQIHDQLDKD